MHSHATRLQLLKPLRSRDLSRTLGKIGAGNEVPDADKLDPLEDLSNYFAEPPVKKMIHLIVQLPPSEYPPPVASRTTTAEPSVGSTVSRPRSDRM
jgi:hypothetical protein